MLKLPAIVLPAFVLLSPSAFGHTTLDTIYTPSGYEDGSLSATVYIPPSPNGIGVILAHGSDKTRQYMGVWCDTLAANGYTAMTIDYYTLLNPAHCVYPKPERAFKTAVQFLRRNAARFKIATDKIVGFGSSEGSIHWGMCLPWDDDYTFFQTDSTISDHLDAAVLFYGVFDMKNYLMTSVNGDQIFQNYFRLFPDLRTTKGNAVVNAANITAPVLLLHGTNDGKSHPMQSVVFRDSLLAYGKQCQLLQDSWGHEFDLSNGHLTLAGLVAKDTVLAFLKRTVLLTEGVAESPELPGHFSLKQNFPNPFNPTTQIQFATPHRSHVTLTVYNTLGQQVATLLNGDIEAGSHSVQFDASNLSSGVYFYRLQAGSFVQTKKLMLVK